LTNEVKQASGYEKKDVNIPVIISVSVVSIVILVVMIVVLADFFQIQKESMVYDSVLSQESKELVELRTIEFETLNNYKLLDAEKGVYQIPIKRAMQLLTEEYSKSQKK
jgi:hypothetical protein